MLVVPIAFVSQNSCGLAREGYVACLLVHVTYVVPLCVICLVYVLGYPVFHKECDVCTFLVNTSVYLCYVCVRQRVCFVVCSV